MKADWIGVTEAMRHVVDAVDPLGAERCFTVEALGRILADEVVAPVDLPLWTNSAMDGFAVRRADVAGASESNPVVLPVVDDIPAGSFPSGSLPPGCAARVMTGAPVPDGADGVIRIEHTDGGAADRGGARVTILSDQDAGRNLRPKGEEISKGAVALAKGLLLSPAALGVCASLGREHLVVVRRPIVGLLTSGDELVEVGDFEQVLSGRKIVSSNSYTLAAQLHDAGCAVRSLGIAADTPDSLREALRRADGCDALVTSAGISVGEHDHMKNILVEFGTEIEFWRVRMRPGSPYAYGRVHGLGGIPWFGLPGNPVSAAVTFELLARPALLRMGGHGAVFRRPITARLLDDYTAPPGLTHFARVVLEEGDDGIYNARLTGSQGSGMLTSLARADGLMIIPEDRAGGKRGDVFKVSPFAAALLGTTPGF